MTSTTKRIKEQTIALRRLLMCGVIGPLFFVGLFLIEGATRIDYNPRRQPVSSLSIGELGWVQAANFVITGLLLLTFTIGLRRTLQPTSFWGTLLIGLVAIGLIGAGIFVTDPLNGYPPGTPPEPTMRSAH